MFKPLLLLQCRLICGFEFGCQGIVKDWLITVNNVSRIFYQIKPSFFEPLKSHIEEEQNLKDNVGVLRRVSNDKVLI